MVEASNRRQWILFVLIVLCALFVVGYAGRLAERTRFEQEILAGQARGAAAEERQAQLRAELEYTQSDAYVRQVAREELGLVLPGDALIIRVEATPVPTAAAPTVLAGAPAAADITTEPVWQQWLELFWPATESAAPVQ